MNAEIRARIRRNVRCYEGAAPHEIDARIRELEDEWDIERVLEANAAAISLFGLAMGAFSNRRWYLLPAAVAGFLMQHAIQGWCPPVPVLRRLGVRTAAEIAEEINALRILRGDFRPTGEAADAVRQAEAVH